MNTARLKLVTWGLAGALGLALVAYIALFLRQRDQLMAPVSQDRMAKVLHDVPEPPARIENMVDREKFESALRKFDWTGKPPEKVVEVEKPAEVVKTGPDPIEKFVKLRGIKVDASDLENGEVVFKYMSDARVTGVTSQDGTVRKMVGAKLDPPLDYIHIESISDAGVEFAFADTARAHEFLRTNPYPLNEGFVVVGDDIIPAQVNRTSIPQSPRVRGPQPKTEMISPNKFRIGYEDAQYINDNYADILAKEVSYQRHRDPTTGKFDGVEVKSVKPDSIASKHGVQSGDVIKSINGHPVTSQSEAIQFVKSHQDQFDVWEVEITNKGQTRTVTYMSPQH